MTAATGATGVTGATGPTGAPGADNHDFAQFYADPDTYASGAFVRLNPYLPSKGGIVLGSNGVTLTLAAPGLYQCSFIFQGQVAPGGYLQILPFLGSGPERQAVVTAHSATSAAPLSVSGSFFIYVPLNVLLTFQMRASAPVALSGEVGISTVSEIRF